MDIGFIHYFVEIQIFERNSRQTPDRALHAGPYLPQALNVLRYNVFKTGLRAVGWDGRVLRIRRPSPQSTAFAMEPASNRWLSWLRWQSCQHNCCFFNLDPLPKPNTIKSLPWNSTLRIIDLTVGERLDASFPRKTCRRTSQRKSEQTRIKAITCRRPGPLIVGGHYRLTTGLEAYD